MHPNNPTRDFRAYLELEVYAAWYVAWRIVHRTCASFDAGHATEHQVIAAMQRLRAAYGTATFFGFDAQAEEWFNNLPARDRLRVQQTVGTCRALRTLFGPAPQPAPATH